MTEGPYLTTREAIKQFAYTIIFIFAFGILFLSVKAAANVKADYSEAYAGSIADSLAGCMERNDVLSFDNLKLCQHSMERRNDFGARLELNGEVQYVNKFVYSYNSLCSGQNAGFVCGHKDLYDVNGNHLMMEWVYRHAR